MESGAELEVVMGRAEAWAQLLELPENKVGEIIGGELIVSPRPASPHGRAATVLGMLLGPPFEMRVGGPGGWWFADEPELHLGEDVLVPDLAAWRRTRMPEVPEVPAFTLAPDWICEVLSPSTSRLDRTRKLPIYGREGVSHVWLIDPLARTLEVFRLAGTEWTLSLARGGNERVRASPFEDLELDLSLLWLRKEA